MATVMESRGLMGIYGILLMMVEFRGEKSGLAALGQLTPSKDSSPDSRRGRISPEYDGNNTTIWKTELQTSRCDSKGDSSEKQALGTLALYLKNRMVPPTTPPQSFWPNFMPISREYCNSCLITDPNVHKLHLFFLCGSTVDCSWLEKKSSLC